MISGKASLPALTPDSSLEAARLALCAGWDGPPLPSPRELIFSFGFRRGLIRNWAHRGKERTWMNGFACALRVCRASGGPDRRRRPHNALNQAIQAPEGSPRG